MDSKLVFKDSFPLQYEKLRQRFDSPGRFYHSWSHINNLEQLFEQCYEQLNDALAVELAIYYHDAIFVPLDNSCEAESAKLLLADLGRLVDQQTLELAGTIILATANHVVPENLDIADQSDCAMFLDMDMSSLGADWEEFVKNFNDIEEEFTQLSSEYPGVNRFVSDRIKFVTATLNCDKIFSTDYFYSKFETTARKNLSKLFDHLTKLAKFETGNLKQSPNVVDKQHIPKM